MPEMCSNCCSHSVEYGGEHRFGLGIAMIRGEDGIWRCPGCKAEFTMHVEKFGPNKEYNRKVFTRIEKSSALRPSDNELDSVPVLRTKLRG